MGLAAVKDLVFLAKNLTSLQQVVNLNVTIIKIKRVKKEIMRYLRNSQGIALVAELLIVGVVIAVIAAVAIKVTGSHAATRCYAINGRQFCYYVPTTTSSGTNTGSSATCSVNGLPGTTVNGTCSANSGTIHSSTSVSPSTPGVNNTNVYTSNGANGANGTATCTVNGVTTTSTTGTCSATSQ